MRDLPGDDGVPPLTPVLDSLRELWALNHQLEMRSSRMLRTLGVTAQQRMVLRVVQVVGPMPAGVLARTLHVHPGTLSTSLRRLEERHLLVRRRDPGDARRVVVSLTPAGDRTARQLEGTVEQAVEQALAEASPRATRAALGFLRALTDILADDGTDERARADG